MHYLQLRYMQIETYFMSKVSTSPCEGHSQITTYTVGYINKTGMPQSRTFQLRPQFKLLST